MSEGLGPEARALLDAARAGMAPDAAAVRRMRGRIDVAMTAAAVQPRLTRISLATKLAGVALALVAVGVIAYVGHDRDPARVVAPMIVPAAPVVAPAPVIAAPPSPPPVAPAVAAPVIATKHEPVGKPAAASPRPIGLAREVELVDLAMAALRGSDPHTALRTVAEHARETAGHGQLAEDAAAIEVEALCQLRDPATAAKLATFDRRFPRSAQRARLTAACP
jgi:hypothetical protein